MASFDNNKQWQLPVAQARFEKSRTLRKLREDFSQDQCSRVANQSNASAATLNSNQKDFPDNPHPLTIKQEPIMNQEALEHAENANSRTFKQNSVKTSHNDYMMEYEKIRQWAIESEINEEALQKLLDMLRRRLLPNLPLTAKEFLKNGVHKKKSQCVALNTRQFEAIMTALTSMRTDIRQLADNQKHLNEQLTRNRDLPGGKTTEHNFTDRCKIKFPIRKCDRLISFETLMAFNPEAKKGFKNFLNDLMEDRTISSCKAIMRKLFAKNVALECSGFKQIKGKYRFHSKYPNIWTCIVEVIAHRHEAIEKNISLAMISVLTSDEEWS